MYQTPSASPPIRYATGTDNGRPALARAFTRAALAFAALAALSFVCAAGLSAAGSPGAATNLFYAAMAFALLCGASMFGRWENLPLMTEAEAKAHAQQKADGWQQFADNIGGAPQPADNTGGAQQPAQQPAAPAAIAGPQRQALPQRNPLALSGPQK